MLHSGGKNSRSCIFPTILHYKEVEKYKTLYVEFPYTYTLYRGGRMGDLAFSLPFVMLSAPLQQTVTQYIRLSPIHSRQHFAPVADRQTQQIGLSNLM